tara:strand:- start:188 stop:550 length:363 start_codon:yes stop_codon:yes gene_type:complete
VWPLVSDYIAASVARSGIGSTAAIRGLVLSGDALLWVVIEDEQITTAIVTQVGISDVGRICEIVACGGRGTLKDLSLLSEIEKYARNQDCRAMRIIGRKGWARALKEYKETRVVLERELI